MTKQSNNFIHFRLGVLKFSTSKDSSSSSNSIMVIFAQSHSKHKHTIFSLCTKPVWFAKKGAAKKIVFGVRERSNNTAFFLLLISLKLKMSHLKMNEIRDLMSWLKKSMRFSSVATTISVILMPIFTFVYIKKKKLWQSWKIMWTLNTPNV